MSAYYNEFDPFAAAWLRELIKDGLIADGVVDERSILDVKPEEIREFTQCHFFAGIGGWSYALRLAGWSDDRPVWTGSPPCQPFSVAGNRKGTADERHLWPAFFNLVRECSPPTVFGEQVAAAIRDNWFDNLQADMEGEGYATGMVVLPACSVNAPHKRDRMWFVADSTCGGRREKQPDTRRGREGVAAQGYETGGFEPSDKVSPLADPLDQRPQGGIYGRKDQEWEDINRHPGCSGTISNHWEDSRLIYCRDGKYRPIPTEPALFPLANGVSNRVGILRGAGNAIVPQVAAEIIKAFMGD
jgi:DNA (cytosine-5)-methyltransferase 1